MHGLFIAVAVAKHTGDPAIDWRYFDAPSDGNNTDIFYKFEQ